MAAPSEDSQIGMGMAPMTHRDEILPPTPEIVVAALDAARELVEQGHCQGQAHAVDPDAECWCAMGALAKVCSTVVLSEWPSFDRHGNLAMVREIIPGKAIFESAIASLKIALAPRWAEITEFNDASGQDAVVNLFHRAANVARMAVG